MVVFLITIFIFLEVFLITFVFHYGKPQKIYSIFLKTHEDYNPYPEESLKTLNLFIFHEKLTGPIHIQFYYNLLKTHTPINSKKIISLTDPIKNEKTTVYLNKTIEKFLKGIPYHIIIYHSFLKSHSKAYIKFSNKEDFNLFQRKVENLRERNVL